MRPRVHVLTLAVDDLERSLTFYRDGLGLESTGIVGTEFTGDENTPAGAVAMFELEGGLILSLYPRAELVSWSPDVAGAPVAADQRREVEVR